MGLLDDLLPTPRAWKWAAGVGSSASLSAGQAVSAEEAEALEFGRLPRRPGGQVELEPEAQKSAQAPVLGVSLANQDLRPLPERRDRA